MGALAQEVRVSTEPSPKAGGELAEIVAVLADHYDCRMQPQFIHEGVHKGAARRILAATRTPEQPDRNAVLATEFRDAMLAGPEADHRRIPEDLCQRVLRSLRASPDQEVERLRKALQRIRDMRDPSMFEAFNPLARCKDIARQALTTQEDHRNAE